MSRASKIAVSFAMVALCLGAIEVASMLILSRYSSDNEPAPRMPLAEDERWLDRFLVGSLRWNLLDNPLTMKDGHVLFRVRPSLQPAEAMG